MAASFLSGAALLGLEVIWFRFLRLFFNPFDWSFAIMLAVVLAGISVGGLLAAQLFKITSEAQRFLPSLVFMNAVILIVSYRNFGFAYNLFSRHNELESILLSTIFLMLPVCCVSGVVFTMLGKALHVELNEETAATGLLTLANTIGGMAGALIAGMLFIPGFGVEKSFFVFACVYGLLAIVVFEDKRKLITAKRVALNYVMFLIFVIAVIIFPFGLMNEEYLNIPIAKYIRKGIRRVAFHEGINESIQYLQEDLAGEPYYHLLITNNHMMSGTEFRSRRYMSMFAYWPMLVHPDAKKALLICFGCGITAKTLTDNNGLERIDVIDISRDVIKMSKVIFPEKKDDPVNDPRVSVHIEDGRFFLMTTKKKYDVITAEPPPPRTSGVVNLYTQEYFQLLYNCLNDGGIVTYWLPVYQLKSSAVKSIVAGFCNVFEHASLWTGAGYHWMMVGIKNPSPRPISAERFMAPWNDPASRSKLDALMLRSPEEFAGTFIADGQRLKDWLSGSLPLNLYI